MEILRRRHEGDEAEVELHGRLDGYWADHLARDLDELVRGGKTLAAKVRRFAPRVLAVLGVGAYRVAFDRPKAQPGRQPDGVGGVVVWVLPNPSGLNAHYQAADLARVYRELREAVGP